MHNIKRTKILNQNENSKNKRLKSEELESGEILDGLSFNEYTSFSDECATTSKACGSRNEHYQETATNYTETNYFRSNNVYQGKTYSNRRQSFHSHYTNKQSFQEPVNLKRSWVITARNKKDLMRKFVFRVVSYNLLAPSLAREHYTLYRGSNPSWVDWNYRKRQIRHQITKSNAEILCLQEMQEDEYENFFLPSFKHLGYASIYMKRYGDNKLDGCCICYKRKKFKIVKQDLVNFYQPGVDVLERENVGIVLLLESLHPKWPGKRVCVATTHILYNPKRGDCKLAQMMLFLAHIDRMAFREMKLNEKKHAYYPTIMCGDFNMDFRSKLYEFIKTSKLENYRSLDRYLMSGQLETTATSCFIDKTLLPRELGISDKCQFKEENDKRCPGSSHRMDAFGGESLSHPFKFDSVYKHYDAGKNTYEVTTCINEFKRTVDYIFYHSEVNEELGESELNVTCKLELLTEDQVWNLNLPSKKFPSDHFMLAADFSID